MTDPANDSAEGTQSPVQDDAANLAPATPETVENPAPAEVKADKARAKNTVTGTVPDAAPDAIPDADPPKIRFDLLLAYVGGIENSNLPGFRQTILDEMAQKHGAVITEDEAGKHILCFGIPAASALDWATCIDNWCQNARRFAQGQVVA